MNQANTVMFAIFIALGVMLIVIPTLEEAQAKRVSAGNNGNHYGQIKHGGCQVRVDC